MDSLVGFRFQPSNQEIILLLTKKRLDPDFSVDTIKEIDFYSFDPWELPRYSGIQSKEPIWYFYSKPYYKYSKSKRAHRRTNSGYWKITGKGSKMKAKNSKDVIGSKKILSFYLHSPISKDAKPEWVMHEIQIEDDPLYKEDFVVCRLERKQANKPAISTNDEGESSEHLVVSENTSPNSVLPRNELLVPNRNHVAEKNQCSDGYNALDNDPFSNLQSPVYPEKGLSYYDCPNNGCDLLNSHCDSEQVNDLINSQGAFQNEYSCEETGQTRTLEFNSSKLDARVLMEDENEADTETFNAWVRKLFEK